MTAPTLRRQDTGSVLILDGVVSESQINARRVTEHEVETREVIADHVQVLARDFSFLWLVSPYPTISGVLTGAARFEEVFTWLDESVGVLVNITRPDLPVERDVLVRSYSWQRRGSSTIEIVLELRQARFATTRAVALAPRADVASTRSGTADKGDRSTEAVADKSLLSSGLDLLTGAF